MNSTDKQLKAELLALPKGAPRPKANTRLGRALLRFTTPPESYDLKNPDDCREIRDRLEAAIALLTAADGDAVALVASRLFDRPEDDRPTDGLVDDIVDDLFAGEVTLPRRAKVKAA